MKDEDLTSAEVRPGVTGRFDHGSLSRRPNSCGSEASPGPKKVWDLLPSTRGKLSSGSGVRKKMAAAFVFSKMPYIISGELLGNYWEPRRQYWTAERWLSPHIEEYCILSLFICIQKTEIQCKLKHTVFTDRKATWWSWCKRKKGTEKEQEERGTANHGRDWTTLLLWGNHQKQ